MQIDYKVGELYMPCVQWSRAIEKNKEIGQASAGENPTYNHMNKIHSNNSACLETNMTPLHLGYVVVAV